MYVNREYGGTEMVNTVYIKKTEDMMQLILEQKFEEKINRNRSYFLYRGLCRSKFSLETSLHRNCRDMQVSLEPCILRNFTKYADLLNPDLRTSVWRQMVVGQHHGLPTRLLDWTYSPLVALHFATSSFELSKTDTYDGAVWKIDAREINRLLPERYYDKLARNNAWVFSVDMLSDVVNEPAQYDSDMAGHAMALLEPPSIDQRIINQYSIFSVIPMSMGSIEEFLDKYTENTVKYVIDKRIKWDVRDFLDQMNMNERTMMPGLDGLSTWLKRHYFVMPARAATEDKENGKK